ncbi:hypothetical protein Acr_01g0004210 [Actinidia rufa]|uniref:Uncharacterized protein n=1 Tax=Actinidia rufa TaxID=165716 RepID=A0A7J0E2Z5_9ERIC|nr:hypothetical protein Acr_01g0004210 [Actinidia rufa]
MFTTHLNKLRLQSVLKGVSIESNLRSSRTSLSAIGYHIVQSLRFYSGEKSLPSENGLGFDGGTVDGEQAPKLLIMPGTSPSCFTRLPSFHLKLSVYGRGT